MERLARCFPIVTETGYQEGLCVHDYNRLRADAMYTAECLQLLRFRIVEASLYLDVAEVHLDRNGSLGIRKMHRR